MKSKLRPKKGFKGGISIFRDHLTEVFVPAEVCIDDLFFDLVRLKMKLEFEIIELFCLRAYCTYN